MRPEYVWYVHVLRATFDVDAFEGAHLTSLQLYTVACVTEECTDKDHAMGDSNTTVACYNSNPYRLASYRA